MTGTKVTAATLVNLVKYQTDQASLKKVRADLRNLKKQFKKTSVQNAKAEIAAVKAAIKAKQNASNQYNNATAKGNAKALKQQQISAQKAASAQRKADEKALKVAEKMKLDASKRIAAADLKIKGFAFDVSRMQGLSNHQQMQAISNARELVNQYRSGAVSLQQMNQNLRMLKVNNASLARQQRNANRQQGSQGRAVNRNNNGRMLAGGSLLAGAGGALSIGALTYLVQDAARNALMGSIERSNGRKMSATMGTDPVEASAIARTVKDRTGFDMSPEKIADIAKDVQDKIGDLSMGEWKIAKDGSSNYSGGGELSDLLNTMVSRGGYSREGSLATVRDAKSPGELAALLTKIRKSANLTDAEFTNLAERINDFAFIAKAAGYDGENFLITLQQMRQSGQLLTEQQSNSLNVLTLLNSAASRATDTLEEKFASSLTQALEDAGVSSKNLEEAFKTLQPLIMGMGRLVGDVTAGLVKLLEWIGKKVPYADTQTGASSFYGSTGNTTTTTPAGAKASFYGGFIPDPSEIKTLSPMFDRANLMQGIGGRNSFNLALPTLSSAVKTDVVVTVDGAQLTSIFNGVADSKIEQSWSNMTWDINQSNLASQ